jgi:hypothetical protein
MTKKFARTAFIDPQVTKTATKAALYAKWLRTALKSMRYLPRGQKRIVSDPPRRGRIANKVDADAG